jgi:hypothetical protein
MSVTPFDIKTILLAKHTQHVVLIHFPVALFIAGMAFDLVTQWTKQRGLADAANLLLNFDGAHDRAGNPRVAVRTRWAETQGHPAGAPGTGAARTEAMQ